MIRCIERACLFAAAVFAVLSAVFFGLLFFLKGIAATLVLLDLTAFSGALAIWMLFAAGCLWCGRMLWKFFTNNSGDYTDATTHSVSCTSLVDALCIPGAEPADGSTTKSDGRYYGLDRMHEPRLHAGDGEDIAFAAEADLTAAQISDRARDFAEFHNRSLRCR